MPQEILKPSFEQVPNQVNQTEQIVSSENKAETVVETKAPSEQTVDNSLPTTSRNQVQAQPVVKLTPRQEEIDDILEDGLSEIYFTLTPEKQAELRQAGGETVKQIDQLLDHAKSQINKIISLIRKFLLIIPGVNRFFLEQEVKIKTDKIMSLKDK
ncbi:MAG TPA: hypothetical protein PKN62_01215 [bacterium]|nr:hypothetical protein [bacterium]